APLRPGLLKAGENAIRIEVLQRHRVDCSVTGTYELWTDLDPTVTGIAFPLTGRPSLGGLQDLSAIGPDASGATTIHVVAPRASRPEVRDRLLRAVQTIALRGRYAHPVVQISENDPGSTPPGTLKVVLAVANELPLAMNSPPAEAAIRPLAGFVSDDRRGATLVISGPAWADVDRAIALLATYRARGADEEGLTVPTSSWSAPDAPLVLRGRSLRFSEMGIPTTEFSGRRLTLRFNLGLPGDFYAGDYGEARLFLDAAIAPTVRAGSRIDIYVNERISATAPIGIGQNVFEQHPIRVAMKHFRPGINTVVVEAILATAADETCAPGSTLPGANRLALFDSTSFEVPSFARIGRRPDLAEVTAAGLVRDEDEPVTVALPRFDLPTYAAAATAITRMAVDTGRVRNVRTGTIADAPPGSVIFVGPAGQLPPEVLTQVGLPPDLGQTWTAPVPASAPGDAPMAAPPAVSGAPRAPQELQDRATTGSNQDIRERWDETLRGEGRVTQAIEAVRRWFRDRFSAGVSAVRSDGAAGASDPTAGASWLIAEGTNPSRDGSWLVITAPTDQALREGTRRITKPTLWSQVSGRLTALHFEPERLTSQPADAFEFVSTEPLTPRNLRLIAANWLSTNVLPYALLIILGCTGLGLATHYLVGQLGRRS
ncbi:MAG: cellulose biosynthesis cyclic di-GMP-binding regulatory protein BcsB, partial [Pseudomonadota bacterium]|nr:cellulose biosynthesis cyclic di-GMP-binding regulatory protein BcsB [Pseudomonadota bacterium]